MDLHVFFVLKSDENMVLQVNSMEVQYYDIQMNELVKSAFKNVLTSVISLTLGGKNVFDTGVRGGKDSFRPV